MPSIITDNFEVYSTGELNGQGTWSGGGHTVENTVYFEGAQAVKGDTGGAGTISIRTSGQGYDAGVISVRMRWESSNNANFEMVFIIQESTTDRIKVKYNQTTLYYLDSGSSWQSFATGVTQDAFHLVMVEWRSSDKYVRYKCDDQAWTAFVAPNSDYTTNLDSVKLEVTGSASPGVGYWDDIRDYRDIRTWKDLDAVRLDLTADYTQYRSLLPIDGDYTGIGDSWNPISGDFSGSYDGQNYRIRELTIEEDPGADGPVNIGMFREVSGDLKNIILVDCEVFLTGTTQNASTVYTVGSLVGLLRNGDGGDGDVRRCIVYSSHDVINTHNRAGDDIYVGGLIGCCMDDVLIYDSWAKINTSSEDTEDTAVAVGGFTNLYATGEVTRIERCFALGDILNICDYGAAGGFFGVAVDSIDSEIRNCYATGDVEGEFGDDNNSWIGGFLGATAGMPDFLIQNCYSEGNVLAGSDLGALGGFVGLYYSDSYSLQNCYNVGLCNPGAWTISGTPPRIGGFAGENGALKLDNCSWAITTSTNAIGYDQLQTGLVNRLVDPDPDYGTDGNLSTFFDPAADVYTAGTDDWNFDTIWFDMVAVYPRLDWGHNVDGAGNYTQLYINGVLKRNIETVNGFKGGN